MRHISSPQFNIQLIKIIQQAIPAYIFSALVTPEIVFEETTADPKTKLPNATNRDRR